MLALSGPVAQRLRRAVQRGISRSCVRVLARAGRNFCIWREIAPAKDPMCSKRCHLMTEFLCHDGSRCCHCDSQMTRWYAERQRDGRRVARRDRGAAGASATNATRRRAKAHGGAEREQEDAQERRQNEKKQGEKGKRHADAKERLTAALENKKRPERAHWAHNLLIKFGRLPSVY